MSWLLFWCVASPMEGGELAAEGSPRDNVAGGGDRDRIMILLYCMYSSFLGVTFVCGVTGGHSSVGSCIHAATPPLPVGAVGALEL